MDLNGKQVLLKDILQKYLKDNYYSIRKFSEKSGVNMMALHRILGNVNYKGERDKYTNPSLRVLLGIAKGMDMSIVQLIQKMYPNSKGNEEYLKEKKQKDINQGYIDLIEAIKKVK